MAGQQKTKGTIRSILTPGDMMSLLETGRILSSSLNLRSLLNTILKKACALTDSPDGSVILFNDVRQSLYFAEAVGANRALLIGQWGKSSAEQVPLKGSKAGSVFRTGRSLINNFLSRNQDHFRGVDQDTRTSTRSMVCVPLAVGKERIGVVQILNKRNGKYNRRDLVILEHFASQAAIAIRNAQLFERLLLHMGMYDTHDALYDPIKRAKELSRKAHTESLTVLFADMRGFTRLSEVIRDPEAILEILNEFLGMLADTVIAHKGVVNKFLGDGVMSFFRDEDHAARALQCAFAMIDPFAKLRDRWNARTNSPLGFVDIGIGIATDPVIIGSVGSSYVRDFTALGPAVNLAACLSDQARNGKRVMIDKKTYLAAKNIIGSFQGPEVFELEKTGQASGTPYVRYFVEKLRTSGSEETADTVVQDIPAAKKGKSVFISYSHRDKAWLRRLQTHLKPYIRAGSLSAWDDTKIKPGSKWRDDIENALKSASLAILLVSPNFLDSDFIASDELPPLLARAKSRGMTILWVPLSSSSYDETEITNFQAAIDPARPLDTMNCAQQNKAFVKLCKAIKTALQ